MATNLLKIGKLDLKKLLSKPVMFVILLVEHVQVGIVVFIGQKESFIPKHIKQHMLIEMVFVNQEMILYKVVIKCITIAICGV